METLYKEKQPFLSNFAKIAIALFSLGLIYWIYTSASSHGNNTILLLISFAAILLLNVLLWLMVLHLKITRYDVRYKYPPFLNSWKVVPVEQIKHWDVREYEWSQYGGWGYRINIFKNRRAYTVINDKVLFLELYNNDPISLGTRNSVQVSRAMEQMKSKPTEI